MKKIYFTLLIAAGFNCMAQHVASFKGATEKKSTKIFNQKKGNFSPLDISGSSMDCSTKYVAGTTMDLNINVHLVENDEEYGDSVIITFPTGITPISTTADSFPSSDFAGGAEYLDLPISGQSISWGDNDNSFGGIGLGDYVVSVKVAIGSSVAGDQTVSYYMSGDEYANAMDASGTFLIKPKVAVDLQTLFTTLPVSCNNASQTVGCIFTNVGTSNITNVDFSYSNNGATPVKETYTGIVKPGDTLVHLFTNKLDMSQVGTYNLKVYSTVPSDGDQTNDTAYVVGKTLAPIVVNLAGVSNSFEATMDLEGWATKDVDSSGLSWAPINPGRTGNVAMRSYENGVSATSDDWLFSSCIDFTAGKLYQLTYWKWLSTGFNGSLEVKLGNAQTVAAMTQSLKPLTALTANSTYTKDSLTFTVASTGTYYVSFRALNTDATNSVALRVDDITLKLLGTVGIDRLNADKFNLYPNPSTGEININVLEHNSQLQIFNMLGECVYSQSNINAGLNTFNLSSVAAKGIYLVKLSDSTGITSKNIVIQ